MEQFLPELIGLGPVGLIAAASLWAYWTEKTKHDQTKDRRLDDAVRYAESVAQIGQATTRALESLTRLLEDRKNV